MISGDTIAAISSAAGPSARMILRLSGPSAYRMARDLAGQPALGGRMARRCRLGFRGLSIPAWVYAFPAPHSYSGEDVVELHVPGNPLLARLLLDELIALGARPAEAGEFTARAYFNGRMDLAEAEGVAATIAARNEQELRAARQLLSGQLARRLRPAMDQLAETLSLIEAGIDFSEEDVSFLSPEQVIQRISAIEQALDELIRHSARFERLSHEPKVVLVGRPSAGKSTLLNALAGTERAVVSPVSGTTRDVIWAEVALGRGIIHLMDVAGLADQSPPPNDPSPAAAIARQMHAHALQAVEEADVVVLIQDATDTRPPVALPRPADLSVFSKLDLAASPPPLADRQLAVSAHSGQNMDQLALKLEELAFGPSGGSALALNARHLQAIEQAMAALRRARQQASSVGAEILALELREALDALGRVLGQVTPDDVLGRIFSTFCIGK